MMFTSRNRSIFFQGAILFSVAPFIGANELEVILNQGGYIDNCEGSHCDQLNYVRPHEEKCHLILQGDGRLVIKDRDEWNAIWSSSYEGDSSPARLRLQRDCNLVIYDKPGTMSAVPIWSTNTAIDDIDEEDGCFLGMYDDCRLSLFKGTPDDIEGELWTNIRLDGLHAGEMLQNGEIAYDASIGAFWIFQDDGNLVAYDDEIMYEGELFQCINDLHELWKCVPDGYASHLIDPVPRWSSGTAGSLGWKETGYAKLWPNGKLELRKRTDTGTDLIEEFDLPGDLVLSLNAKDEVMLALN